MSLDQLNPKNLLTAIFTSAPVEAIPFEFELATDDTIQPGDFVLTCFGGWGVVNHVRVNSKGAIGYSINMLYRTSNGRWIAPPHTTRRWVWDSEIMEVLS